MDPRFPARDTATSGGQRAGCSRPGRSHAPARCRSPCTGAKVRGTRSCPSRRQRLRGRGDHPSRSHSRGSVIACRRLVECVERQRRNDRARDGERGLRRQSSSRLRSGTRRHHPVDHHATARHRRPARPNTLCNVRWSANTQTPEQARQSALVAPHPRVQRCCHV